MKETRGDLANLFCNLKVDFIICYGKPHDNPCRNSVFFKYTFKLLKSALHFMIYVYFKTVCFKYTTFGHLKSILEEYVPYCICTFHTSILEVYLKYTSSILQAYLFIKLLNCSASVAWKVVFTNWEGLVLKPLFINWPIYISS